MALTGCWLIDKSAFARIQLGQAAEIGEWKTRINRGLIRISPIKRLELGYSARSGVDGRAGLRQPASLVDAGGTHHTRD